MELNVSRSRRGLLIGIAAACGLWVIYADGPFIKNFSTLLREYLSRRQRERRGMA